MFLFNIHICCQSCTWKDFENCKSEIVGSCLASLGKEAFNFRRYSLWSRQFWEGRSSTSVSSGLLNGFVWIRRRGVMDVTLSRIFVKVNNSCINNFRYKFGVHGFFPSFPLCTEWSTELNVKGRACRKMYSGSHPTACECSHDSSSWIMGLHCNTARCVLYCSCIDRSFNHVYLYLWT